MDARLTPLLATLRLGTRLFLNCFDGIDDKTARARPNERTNSMAFVALHLHDARHYLAKYLGVAEPNPFAPVTAAAQSIEGIEVYPSLAEQRTAWLEITATLERRFEELTADELDRPSPGDAPEFPVDDQTTLGGIAFLLAHEAYHVGQLALLRRLFRLPPMSWMV